MNSQYPLCLCGCGKPVTKFSNKYIWGHNYTKPWNKGLTKETDPRILLICNSGIHLSEETRRRQSIAKKGVPNPKMSKIMKEFWQDSEFIRKRMRAHHLTPNKSELSLNSTLQNYFPNQFRYVGNGEVIIGRRCPDFINVNGRKQIIELFGNYWHRKLFAEAEKINHYKKYGFDCLVIWENELKNNKRVISKIKRFMEVYD